MSEIIKTLHGYPNVRPPIWLMRQAGRYLSEYQEIRKSVPSFMDLCFHEELATEVTLQPLRRFDLDAAILFSDILVIPQILGQTVRFVEKEGPQLDSLPPLFFEKAKDIDIEEALSTPLKVLRNVRNTLPPTKAVIGFAGSPWTIATYMLERKKTRSFSNSLGHLESNSQMFRDTMALLEGAVGTFLMAQIQAGADAVQIFDSWAKSVPVAYQTDWIIGPTRRIIERIRSHYPSTPIIYYGRGVHTLYSQIGKGFSGIAFGVDEMVSIPEMNDLIEKVAPIQGNLSPQILAEGGQKMEMDVSKLLTAFHGKSYVFNLGHGILPHTPVSHVTKLIDLVKNGVNFSS